jgi:cyclic pyranopterin phosphate synthase
MERVELTHLTADGQAHMVNVGDKDVTARRATARACVRMNGDTFVKLTSGETPKGDVLASEMRASACSTSSVGVTSPLRTAAAASSAVSS